MDGSAIYIIVALILVGAIVTVGVMAISQGNGLAGGGIIIANPSSGNLPVSNTPQSSNSLRGNSIANALLDSASFAIQTNVSTSTGVTLVLTIAGQKKPLRLNNPSTNHSSYSNFQYSELSPDTQYELAVTGYIFQVCKTGVSCPQFNKTINDTFNITTIGSIGSKQLYVDTNCPPAPSKDEICLD
jgi:hypothetical protein